MKKIILSLTIVFHLGANAQINKNLGIGYFGHTITHPGIVLEFEREKMYTEKISVPIRFDIGYYRHPRNHDGVFADISFGSRRYFKSGFFVEQSIGVGILETILNEDVFEVDDDGNVMEASKFNEPDFMPSFSLGLGYNLAKNGGYNAVWIRPKIFWQIPHKMSSTFNPTLQVGYSFRI